MRSHLCVVLALAIGFAGCGAAPIKLINSPATPAASGEITTEEGDNGNLKLKIEVKHLATPSPRYPFSRCTPSSPSRTK